MRIALIGFPGVEYTIELSEGLSKIEEVMLMLPKPLAEHFREVIHPNVDLYAFYYPRMRYPTNILMAYDIVRKINAFRPHIVHIQRGNPWFNLFAIPFLKKYCIVTTIHDVILLDYPSQRIPRFTFLPSIRAAKQIIVHGEKLKEHMIRIHRKRPDEVNVMRRGVNSIYTRYACNPMPDDGRTVLYFGRIWGYKGLSYLIEAEPFISQKIPGAKIVIAGEGEDFSKYRALMVNPEHFVVHNKFIPNEMVPELFQQASVVVLPYVDGSQSGVIPMAYAFGKPVIVTDVGSLPENVFEGITGHIVPPRDARSLADAIVDLLLDSEKRTRMGKNALKKTQQEFSWDYIARKTVEVYRKALEIKNF
jgi:glycosyltransferase involved in cell wall biosynthesis